MQNFQQLTSTSISGEIRKVIFEKPESGFAIVALRDGEGIEQVAVGPLAGLEAGKNVELEGKWENNTEFGRRFKVEHWKLVLPGTPEGICKFLNSCVKGIGKKRAAAIVARFGAETLRIIDKFPRRLAEVPGVSKTRAADIARIWKENVTRRDGMIYLQGLGITPGCCARLYQRYGEEAPDIVRNNPFRLADEVNGIGFLKADVIARSIGIPEDSPDRLAAAAVYALNFLVGNGNVCASPEKLAAAAAELLQLAPETAGTGIRIAVERRLLRELDGMIYTPLLARAELALPQRIAALSYVRKFAGTRLRPLREGAVELAPAQLRAVEQVSASPLSIITGGPGVGKTTVVGEIVRRARHARLRIFLGAPTGRAAKRLAESTGVEAKTLHRLLLFDPGSMRFAHDADNPLPCDLLIVDEVSMLDLPLAEALFAAVAPGTSVVLVGDSDQLPSVGPGTVFADFLRSGFFAVTRLDQIFRQAAGSRIVVNAHRVNRGFLPERAPDNGKLADFYWIEQDDPARAAELVEKMVAERIPVRFGFDPVNDIQVLSPMNRGTCGTAALNARLEARLNGGDHPEFQFGDRVFREGDKVMQRSNDYDKSVFNGDLGVIEHVFSARKKFTVTFDGSRSVEYAFEEADRITLAYAVTVHKSQGCEFPAVVLPLLTQHYLMLQRNLLYTGMTRARKLLILIGDRKAIELAVSNRRREVRFSLLGRRLRDLR